MTYSPRFFTPFGNSTISSSGFMVNKWFFKAVTLDIPLDARLLSIADTFDAITSTRSYRSGATVTEAFSILQQASGTQFDPNLIALLDDVKMGWIRIYKEHNEDLSEFETLFDLS